VGGALSIFCVGRRGKGRLGEAHCPLLLRADRGKKGVLLTWSEGGEGEGGGKEGIAQCPYSPAGEALQRGEKKRGEDASSSCEEGEEGENVFP